MDSDFSLTIQKQSDEIASLKAQVTQVQARLDALLRNGRIQTPLKDDQIWLDVSGHQMKIPMEYLNRSSYLRKHYDPDARTVEVIEKMSLIEDLLEYLKTRTETSLKSLLDASLLEIEDLCDKSASLAERINILNKYSPCQVQKVVGYIPGTYYVHPSWYYLTNDFNLHLMVGSEYVSTPLMPNSSRFEFHLAASDLEKVKAFTENSPGMYGWPRSLIFPSYLPPRKPSSEEASLGL